MRQQIFACLAGKNNTSATLLQVFVYFGWPRGAGNCSMGLFEFWVMFRQWVFDLVGRNIGEAKTRVWSNGKLLGARFGICWVFFGSMFNVFFF